jgi:nucleoside-diphosphate-sugar epimerase
MTRHVLITGGAGYIGSILTEHLLRQGDKVTAVDTLMYGDHCLFQFCENPNYEFIRGDARDERIIRDLVPQADVIVPLAAIVGAPACALDPELAKTTNFDSVMLVNRLRSKNQLVIYPNTNSGYGIQTEEDFCTEDSPLSPISVYGRTKVDAEMALLDSENTITFRLATVFGTSSRMRIDLLVNHFTFAAVTERYLVIFEKDFKRNYIHIRDVADCFIYAMENSEKMRGRPYNLGLDDANLSKEQLALKIKEHVANFYIHFAPIGEDPDKRDYIVSNQRLREAGFEAQRGLDAGIEELIKAYRTLGRKRYANI